MFAFHRTRFIVVFYAWIISNKTFLRCSIRPLDGYIGYLKPAILLLLISKKHRWFVVYFVLKKTLFTCLWSFFVRRVGWMTSWPQQVRPFLTNFSKPSAFDSTKIVQLYNFQNVSYFISWGRRANRDSPPSTNYWSLRLWGLHKLIVLTSSFDRTNLALKLDGEETKFVQIGPRNIKLLILPLSLPTLSYKYNLIVVKFLLAQRGCFSKYSLGIKATILQYSVGEGDFLKWRRVALFFPTIHCL